MGNCCGTSSGAAADDDDDAVPARNKPGSNDPFAKPGRRLGGLSPAHPAQITGNPSSSTAGGTTHSSAVPANIIAGGRLGGDSTASDARSAAARAAEQRSTGAGTAHKQPGRLGQQLASQKAQTRTETLQEASRDELRRREADAADEARTYN